VPDHLSPEGRSRNMAAIRAKNTKPELAVRRALYARGLRGWRCHLKHLPGKPDLAFTRWKVAVFVDGAFWHGHPDHFTPGQSGAYWDTKIARTKERDRLADEALSELGWTVLRFWDFDVLTDLDLCVEQIVGALVSAGHRLPLTIGPSSLVPGG
jgi:DNA mismatch endonuclease (patch repair protein)